MTHIPIIKLELERMKETFYQAILDHSLEISSMVYDAVSRYRVVIRDACHTLHIRVRGAEELEAAIKAMDGGEK